MKAPGRHLFAPVQPHAARLFRSVRLRRPIGLEIELAYPGNTAVIPPPDGAAPRIARWNWVHDGSITPGGIEMVVNPLVGQDLVDGLTQITDGFARAGSAVDASCGYHVHIGTEEWSAYELRRLLLLYHRFEDLFYSLVTEGRDRTRLVNGEPKCYCKRIPWKGSWYERLMALTRQSHIRQYLINTLYPQAAGLRGSYDMARVRKHKYEACRYYGLNLHTWFERGTVEYRHHQGTLECDRLINWALWCGWFTELASSLSDRQVRSIVTVDQLLHGEWRTGAGVVRIPSGVAEWVLRTLEEQAALRVQAAAKPPLKKVKTEVPVLHPLPAAPTAGPTNL